MTERSKVHAWNACVPPKGTEGSNPSLSVVSLAFRCCANGRRPTPSDSEESSGKRMSVVPQITEVSEGLFFAPLIFFVFLLFFDARGPRAAPTHPQKTFRAQGAYFLF